MKPTIGVVHYRPGEMISGVMCKAWLKRPRHLYDVIPEFTCVALALTENPVALCPVCNHFVRLTFGGTDEPFNHQGKPDA